MAKRVSWGAGGKLCCLCIVLAPFVFAGPATAKGTLTILPAGTEALSINDSGVVTGTEDSGLGFLRTPDGTITTFKAEDNAIFTQPQWINSSGAITGYYQDSNKVFRGFVRDAAGAVTTFDAPGAVQAPSRGTYTISINAKGVVIGTYDCQIGTCAFVRAVDGTVTSIDMPSAISTNPSSINDKGEIVGSWLGPGATMEHGFFRSTGGNITTFDEPESHNVTFASAVNDKGVITGAYRDANTAWHGFVRQPDGTFTTFGVNTGGYAINAKGTVVGFADRQRVHLKAFGLVRYPSGRTETIGGPNANGGTYAFSINKDGVVVGSYATRPNRHFAYTDYGFIWTP